MVDLEAGCPGALRRVADHEVDPAWGVSLPSDRERERVAESLGALCEAGVGVRGAREEDGPGTSPLFVASGVFTADALPHLLPGPDWTRLDVSGGGRAGRQLDLREAMLVRDDTENGLRSTRFLSAGRPGIGVLVATAPTERFAVRAPFEDEPPAVEQGRAADTWWARSCDGDAGIAVAVRDRWSTQDGRRSLERVVAWSADAHSIPEVEPIVQRVVEAERVGVAALVDEHRAAWRRRWADADVVVEGDPVLQRAARLAVYHLLTAAASHGAAAIGPRGATGAAYGGHVFWDADVFVLPALAAIAPDAARAVVRYRIDRLPAARSAARALGLGGARFPWESAASGVDVTPDLVRAPGGGTIVVRTGDQEEHIVSDVAWAADLVARWTGDARFLDGPAGELVLDAARYWASRVELDAAGRGHVRDVMGPDEYHPAVDDDAFTNVMARWTLRRAAALVDARGGPTEAARRWREVADDLVDGWDAARGTYEQFAGYWTLEPLLADLAPRPFGADMLLGPERVAASQVVKQPDVLMLHQLVPDELVPGSLPAAIDAYEPRTCHGSSLSPATVAGLQARAGRADEAAATLDLAARIDLDDLTGTTAAGLHLATMGGLWQALAGGFLGVRPVDGALHVDPCLPAAWASLRMTFRFQGEVVSVLVDADGIEVRCERPLHVVVHGRPSSCDPPGRRWAARPVEEAS